MGPRNKIDRPGISLVRSPSTAGGPFMRMLFPAIIAAVLSATAALAADPATTAQTTKGPTLVDAKGMTLYTFDKDSAGKSACNGPCAGNWPPLAAPASASPTGS